MIAKRLFDVVSAGLGLILLAPLLLIVALWVKLDSPGPVIFRQERVGQFGRVFLIWKFRSMSAFQPAGPLLTVGADARITKAGRLIRRFKIDELPQLVNVIRGDMSIVGPRPEVPRYVALYSEAQRRRVLSVRPGITDPASILFADESEVLSHAADPEYAYVHEILPVKLRMYEEYVSTQSFLGDLCVILKTFGAAAFWGKKR